MKTEHMYAKVVGVKIDKSEDTMYIKAEKNNVLIGKIAKSEKEGGVDSSWIAMLFPSSHLQMLGVPVVGDWVRIDYDSTSKVSNGKAISCSKPYETNESTGKVESIGNDKMYGTR